MADFHNWTGDEEIDTQVPQFLNEDNAATLEKLDTKFNKSLEIATSSDLNNFTDEGFYYCNTDFDASTMLNCPTNYAFGLMVWGKDKIVYQEVREYNRSSKNQDNNNCWRRSYYSSEGVQDAWSNWQKVAYTATTLAGYGITDGMSKDVTNSIGASVVMKRNIDTEFLSILGGTEYNKGAIIRLYGGEASAGAGVFALRASNSSNSAIFSGTPSGVLRWDNKNIVRSVNNSVADANGNVNIVVDATLSETSPNPVQNKTITNALEKMYLADGVLSAPPSSSAYISKVASDSFICINDITQVTIEQSSDGTTWETVFDSETASDSVKLAYKNGLDWSPAITIDKNKIARVTLNTHTTKYFTSIAINMKIINNYDYNIQNPYKCYAGFNSTTLKATDTIKTYGSTPSTIFTRSTYNIVQYVFNEDKKDLDLKIMGVYCKGTEPNRTVLKYDKAKGHTVTSFDIEAPHFIGTAQKAVQDGNGNIISKVYANTLFGNSWVGKQDFEKVKLGYETYSSPVGGGGGNTPRLSVMHYRVTKAFNLDLSHLSTALEIEASTVFTAYIESAGDYPLTITNAGTIKYIGSASDVAITSAGLLLNIMIVKDAEGNVTSIVQASKLEGGA